jgi:hypothetical protein
MHSADFVPARRLHTRFHSEHRRQLTGCRIPSLSRRVREKTLPVAGFLSRSTLGSVSLLAHPATLEAPLQTRTASLEQFPRAPFHTARVRHPLRVRRAGLFIEVRYCPRFDLSPPNHSHETVSSALHELRIELAKWYHPAVSPVKRLRQENEEPETVGHPPFRCATASAARRDRIGL